MRRSILLALIAMLAPIFLVAPAAWAHFPFILISPGGAAARVIMSETLTPDPAVKIDTLAGIKLFIRDGGGHDAPLAAAELDDALSAALPGTGTRTVHGVADLGVMQRGDAAPFVLIYYPKAVAGDAFAAAALGSGVPIELVPVRIGGEVRLRLLVKGAPVAERPVRLVDGAGQQIDLTTDSEGLTPAIKEPGRYGAWARDWADETGTRSGKSYSQVRRYATLVFDTDNAEADASAPEAGADADGFNGVVASPFVPLPRPSASFGAVECDGWLYVYGGHSATRHQYSTASVSGRLARMNLNQPGEWEQSTGGVAVQGMNLAAHNGKIYRVGGMEPRNGPDAASDNYSIAEAARFDPSSLHWETIRPLPIPRSSHDMVVVGDRLMIFGGWRVRGAGTKPEWPDTFLSLDLSNPDAEWESAPQPFQRRALIAGVLGDQIYILGGFDAEDVPHADVEIYNVKTRAWSKGPAIPGVPRNGFAPAACVVDGRLYLSVSTGEMFRLSEDRSAWELFARASPRIVHRLVPFGSEILVIGGAAGAAMTDLIEVVQTKGEEPGPLGTAGSAKAGGAGAADAGPKQGAASKKAFAAHMSEVEEVVGRLDAIEQEAWRAPGADPESQPAAEVAKLVTLLREAGDDPSVAKRPAKFHELMKESQARAGKLHELLKTGGAGSEALSSQFARVLASCKECHREFRR